MNELADRITARIVAALELHQARLREHLLLDII